MQTSHCWQTNMSMNLDGGDTLTLTLPVVVYAYVYGHVQVPSLSM